MGQYVYKRGSFYSTGLAVYWKNNLRDYVGVASILGGHIPYSHKISSRPSSASSSTAAKENSVGRSSVEVVGATGAKRSDSPKAGEWVSCRLLSSATSATSAPETSYNIPL